MAAPTILVTGAGGFAGRHLVAALPSDARVLAWDRLCPSTPEPRATWRTVDLLNRRAVHEAIGADAPTAIYHLAGAAHVGRSFAEAESTLASNVLGTHHLLDALHHHRVSARVVVIGSGLIYQPSDAVLDEHSPVVTVSPYALSKLAQEQLTFRAHAQDGIAGVVARAFNHIGPGQAPGFFASSFARQIALIEAGLAPPVLSVGNLEARRDISDVRDIVRGYIALMERGRVGAFYNVCSGTALRVGDVLDKLLALSHTRIRVETDATLLRPHDTPVVHGSHARITTDTGWRPSISLHTTLADLLAWWRVTVRSAQHPA